MLSPFINQKFTAPIWRMEIDSSSRILFLEIRDHTEKQVSFAAVNLANGHSYFNNLQTPERWLTGIETAYNGLLLLHNYQSATGPAHKGLTAIDAISAQTRWTSFTLAFDHLSINGPVVFNSQVQPQKLFLLDLETGSMQRAYDPAADKPLNNNITVPQLIPQSLLADIRLPGKPYANTVHFISYNSFRIVSLHTLLEQQLQQHLYIYNKEGSPIYHDLLNGAIQKMQPEAFVLHNNQLVYLKDRSGLIVLNL